MTIKKTKIQKVLEKIIFFSRWVLPISYLVLFGGLLVYLYFNVKEFVEYVSNIQHYDKNSAMLTFVELIDVTMVANLGKMVITGSWNSFVSKDHGYKNENISSGLLKVKMSTSLIGVTGIALLQRAVEIDSKGNLLTSWDTLYKLGFIHGLFLIGSVVLEIVDYFHEKIELQKEKFELKEGKNEFEKEKEELKNLKYSTKTDKHLCLEHHH